MTVVEYIPAFVDRDDPLRTAKIEHPSDALEVDWVKSKGSCYLKDGLVMKHTDQGPVVIAQIIEE